MILTLAQQLFAVALGTSALMFALWLLQRRTRDAGVVDVGWAASLALAAIFIALTSPGDPVRRAIIAVLAGVWGLRLASHLLVDRVLRGPEDGRYQMMRERFASRVQPVFFVFFQAQALLVVILAAPFFIAARSVVPPAAPAPTWLDIAGVFVWCIGIVGESIADAQLRAFKRRPDHTGRVCDVGLWRYSRHPNYFFEWLIWVAYALVASSTFTHSAWLAWSAPLLMLLFVLKLTGIPPTEARAIRSRGEAYRRYQRTTSAFVPWFPHPDPELIPHTTSETTT